MRTGFPASLFAIIALLMGVDLLDDAVAGASLGHISFELGIMGVAVVGTVLLWREWQVSRRDAERLTEALATARVEGERWREEAQVHLRGLSVAIDAQFDEWKLTQAEREVGFLLLKGLSLKDIARIRSTSERTVRQQAFTIYGKAGLGGRAELSAFFLEDLLLPTPPTDAGASA